MTEQNALIQRGMDMDPQTGVSIRDLAILQLKLLIDGLKDGALFAMSSWRSG